MPSKLIKMLGKELSSNVFLTVPNGGVWEVGLEKSNGKIWFNDNWNKFIDYYSIDYGFLLLFKYEGNSSFHVLIFDTTTFEIQYPHHDGMKLGNEVEKSDSVISISSSRDCSDRFDDDDDECRYELHTTKRARTNLGFNLMKSPSVEAQCKSKIKLESCDREFKSKRCKVEDCIAVEDIDVVKNHRRRKLASKTRSSRGWQKAIRRAKKMMIKTKNPSFMLIIEERNIKKRYAYIPSSFGKKYLGREDEIIEIQGSSSKRGRWEIQCKGWWAKRMGVGWSVFCKESNLRVGDVVVFELVKRSKNRVMKFTVFPSVAV
ncbi:B3 domain-containing transcription factor VRN1-like [Cucumis melo var. makuwa]|nr:B3 domain-containing transcription factor VRN1-like [Cucumis melo]KAA0044698.1 B3 domain-containing transcription factor VRN1-like [Cucumis melo var. makuwa]TYK16889.1 B3 domain-containing transcription factor VRN1-like [Cucumis melo var. makuwa]